MSEELRRVRDTLIEELRRTESLTVAGRALFARYAAMSAAEKENTPAAEAETREPPPAGPPAAAPRRRPTADEEDEFGGSFMVRSNTPQPTIPGYRDTQPDLPRSMRDRRR